MANMALNWNAGVAGTFPIDHYNIYRNGSKVAQASGLSFTDTGLNPSTLYSYNLSSVDSQGHESVLSPTLSATTLPAPPPPPVVTNASFSLDSTSGHLTAGETIGTMVATNSPTSWAFTAGNTAGNFAISNAGVITLTGAGVTNLKDQAGSASLTLQATNAGGSGAGMATIAYRPVPVVSAISFNLDTTNGKLTVNQTIGTVTATNSPTSWAITAGNSAGNFAIDNSGVITLTGTGVTNLNNQTGSASLTVQATNVSGSGSGTATINYQPHPPSAPTGLTVTPI